MHIKIVTGLLVLLCCELCLTIKVPNTWNDSSDSAVNDEHYVPVYVNKQQNVQTLQKSSSIPREYFQYTAKKPQFATDVAAFHGVKNPQQHYKANPIKPFTGQQKPVLGIRHLLNENRDFYQPYQKYIQTVNQTEKHVRPMSTDYEVFHPYKAEEPALQEIYKDPILTKIKNDLHDSKSRLQAYEEDTGRSNIASDEYTENIKKTDAKLFPQQNVPVQYEIHRPERRPIYYREPLRDTRRDRVLNQRFKHPWNQHNIKIRPEHYKPLKKHLQQLRHQHATKYDDEHNEYPQMQLNENIAEPADGFDIYEKGKQKYTQIRNNVDESINKAVRKNTPNSYQKLELQPNESKSDEEDDEFIPVKNYAQVRKTETIKHVPKTAAFDDAETYEEIFNAPRLREAIKSTKAQIVYSEEGYEDSAYDHAGEQKHASDHEGHGGSLKETAKSEGLYKIPTVLGSYQDGRGSEHRDNIEHEKQWNNDDIDNDEETEAEDYSENQYDKANDANIHTNRKLKAGSRNKREDENKVKNNGITVKSEFITQNTSDMHSKNNTYLDEIEEDRNNENHEVDKRETNFEIPTINLNTTYLNEDEILKIAKRKISKKKENIKNKYPYYFNNLESIHENSPLRYAENLMLIPKKSEGGTEFYDSRSTVECLEVENDFDPIPEKLKNGENPTEEDDNKKVDDESSYKNKTTNSTVTKPNRLGGLGDKIDCFKAKYFGLNPLDSPFFKEDIISNPEPIFFPKLSIFEKLKIAQNSDNINWKKSNDADLYWQQKANPRTDIFVLLDKLRINSRSDESSKRKLNDNSEKYPNTPLSSTTSNDSEQSNVYTDVLTNIKNDLRHSDGNSKVPARLLYKDPSNKTYTFFQNKEEVTQSPPKLRRKRAASFIYEPYKIIRDSQYQDSKRTATTSNISPLIKQLQTSRVVDRVSRSNREEIKPTLSSRTYVDIGKNDRTISNSNPSIVDISIDQRRGEPRYEIRPTNHKSEYTPVENKRAMSVEDYKSHATMEEADDMTSKNSRTLSASARGRQRFQYSTTTIRPVYDVTPYLPKINNNEKVSASSTVKKPISITTPVSISQKSLQIKGKSNEDTAESDEDYDDEEEEEDEQEIEKDITITTTTTTTIKPAFKRRTIISTTTERVSKYVHEDEPERLKLVTRFRNHKPVEKTKDTDRVTESLDNKYKLEEDSTASKYREKKKKSSKSTMVTDMKKYGNEDDDDDEDLDKEEIDAMIGIKHNADEYMPSYEREERNKERGQNQYENESKDNDEEETDNDNDDDSDDDEDDETEDFDDEEEDGDEEESSELTPEVTTTEPTKRTLPRTTEAPPPTVALNIKTTSAPLHNLRHEIKPTITRKKIEIHEELPVNKSAPHITQFKQDIKEVEIIKEMPASNRKLNKKVKPLELYKDDNLAKDINKLEDVEVFSEHIDLDKGPKHGGNYRQASKEDLKLLSLQDNNNRTSVNDGSVVPAKDVIASQSENRKRVELEEYSPQRMHGGNLYSIADNKRTRNTGRTAKLIELSSTPPTEMHGGNFKHRDRKRGGRKSEKLIELDDDRHDNDSTQDDYYKSMPHNARHDRLHGGNYRSAKLVDNKAKSNNIGVNNPAREARRSATVLLNNFVQAAPVLTTTPGYIVDPSKRMYYYVDV